MDNVAVAAIRIVLGVIRLLVLVNIVRPIVCDLGRYLTMTVVDLTFPSELLMLMLVWLVVVPVAVLLPLMLTIA